jgi:hypothetical protein
MSNDDEGQKIAWGARGREFKSPRPDHFSADEIFKGRFKSYSQFPRDEQMVKISSHGQKETEIHLR